MKKIMFNDKFGLTDAVLQKIKELTRRLMKNQSGDLEGYIHYTKPGSDLVYVRADFDNGLHEDCPYAIGEIVAVAQPYSSFATDQYDGYYKVQCMVDSVGWDNKMFVKAEWMPHQIEILDIRPEQLQEITEEDCMKEGVQVLEERYYYRDNAGRIIDDFDNPCAAFASLIDKISGRGTWDRNPFSWRIEFKLVK